MDFIDIRKLVLDEKLKNPEGLASVFKKEEAAGGFLQKIQAFIGKYSGIVISNHGFSTKSEYLVKVTKKTLQIKIKRETGVVKFLYDFELEKLYQNNMETSEDQLQKFMDYMKKIGTDLMEEKAYMWDIKKEDA